MLVSLNDGIAGIKRDTPKQPPSLSAHAKHLVAPDNNFVCFVDHVGFLKLSRLGFRAACSLAILSASCFLRAARVGGTWFVGIPVARFVRLISIPSL